MEILVTSFEWLWRFIKQFLLFSSSSLQAERFIRNDTSLKIIDATKGTLSTYSNKDGKRFIEVKGGGVRFYTQNLANLNEEFRELQAGYEVAESSEWIFKETLFHHRFNNNDLYSMCDFTLTSFVRNCGKYLENSIWFGR